jgi:hypothetical protein
MEIGASSPASLRKNLQARTTHSWNISVTCDLGLMSQERGTAADYHATFSDGSFVPKMPPHRLGAGIYYRDSNWFARLNLLHAFAQHEVAFDTPTPGYNLLNAEVRYTFKIDEYASVTSKFVFLTNPLDRRNAHWVVSTTFANLQRRSPRSRLTSP